MSIVLADLSKFYDEHLVVNKVSLEINDGELFVLLGGSGSGKSTILRLIAGLTHPDEGTIQLNGADVTRVPTQKRGVGVVFQNYALFKHMDVRRNVEFGLRIRGIDAEKRRNRAEELLDLVGLGGLGSRFPAQLSGGQRQRVAVARALAYDPSVLLLDEPFGALDVQVRTQVRESFRELQRRLKMTTILVTHDQEEAFELGDRIGVLERGRLLEVGDPESLYARPRTEGVATFLGGGNVLVGRVRDQKIVLGEVQLPLPSEAPRHEDDSPVRVLFRPESVVVDAPSTVPVIGSAILRETYFVGSHVRLRFEVPSLQGARQLAPSTHYGQRIPIIEARANGLNRYTVGDTYQLGLASYHVLAPTGIKFLALIEKSVSASAVVRLGSSLASAGKGAMTLLSVCAESERPVVWQALESAAQAIGENSTARIETKLRIGQELHEIAAEAQEGFYEVALVPRAISTSSEEGFGRAVNRLVGEIGIPVMFVGESHRVISKILICTAGGEPGRGDVRLGGRIARQTGAFVTLLHISGGRESEQEQKRVLRHLDEAQSMLYSMGIQSVIEGCRGAVVESVLRTARDGEFDLIVVGASGSSVGKISEEITRGASCPVLVVPSLSTGA